MTRRVLVPALLGFAAVLPFLIMEVMAWGFQEDFPVALFVLLWLFPAAFFAIALPIVRRLHRGVALWVRVAALGVLGWVWVSIVVDQMPCFLGVPNCD